MEWLKCQVDPLYFMVTYGRIKDEAKGTIPFQPYPHLVDAVNLFQTENLVIFLKARQVCFTWLMALYNLWTAMFHDGAKCVELSKSEDAANEVIDYCRFAHGQLPEPLRISIGKDQSSLMTFPTMHSQIRALASTETAGIGFGGATLITLDEFDFHPYASQNYAEIKPMIDAGGSRKMVIGSAPNKLISESKFKELWFGAKSKANNFAPRFWAYNVMPYRDETWYEDRRRDYDPLELVTRYPKSEEEALSSTKDLCRFDVDSITWQMEEARRWTPLEERYNGLVKIYKRPVAGEKYAFAIDTAEGGVSDPAVGVIIDWRTCEEVACFAGNIPVDEQARIVVELGKEYVDVYYAPERNADGRRLIEKLQNAGITNFYLTSKDKPGWWTSSSNRPVLIGDLAEGIFKRTIRLRNLPLISQFFSFIRTDKKPEGEATKGAHDDYIMAWGIALQARKAMPVGTMRASNTKYRD